MKSGSAPTPPRQQANGDRGSGRQSDTARRPWMVAGIGARMPAYATRPHDRVFLKVDQAIARHVRTIAQALDGRVGLLLASLRDLADDPFEILEHPPGIPFQSRCVSLHHGVASSSFIALP
jgi:hypothetical protein